MPATEPTAAAAQLDEFKIIELIRQHSGDWCSLAMKFRRDDDCAWLAVSEQQTCISVDSLSEGLHFPVGTPPLLIGYRALLVCASDLAAMGARPVGCVLNLLLPAKYNNRGFLAQLARGIGMATCRTSLPLIGGNLSRAANLTLSFTVIGESPEPIKRQGCQVGDLLYVSGDLGAAAAGLNFAITPATQLTSIQAALRAAFFCPAPRLQLGLALRSIATACIDISDGLLADLSHLLGAAKSQAGPRSAKPTSPSSPAASGNSNIYGAALQLAKLPYAAAMSEFSPAQCERLALTGGDDYELLFTLPPTAATDSTLATLRQFCRLTQLGEITAGGGIRLWRDGREAALPANLGWQHL